MMALNLALGQKYFIVINKMKSSKAIEKNLQTNVWPLRFQLISANNKVDVISPATTHTPKTLKNKN